MSECFACTGLGPGGLIAETPGWIVDHCIGPLGVGTLIVKPRRHVLHVAELDAHEAEELGRLLRRVTSAVTTLSEPDQVYVTLWLHMNATPVHIHFVVQPVTRAQMDELGQHGPKLQVAMFDRREPPDLDAAAEFAARARALLSQYS
jgi:diadenosine tetraphosphate (Ap4A) HIT family hydrolase